MPFLGIFFCKIFFINTYSYISFKTIFLQKIYYIIFCNTIPPYKDISPRNYKYCLLSEYFLYDNQSSEFLTLYSSLLKHTILHDLASLLNHLTNFVKLVKFCFDTHLQNHLGILKLLVL